jgi:hypothetical protein
LSPLIRTLDRFFTVFEHKHLSNATRFLKLIKAYIDHHIPSSDKSTVAIHENIKVETDYLTRSFVPYKTIMKRLTLSKHQLAIYKHTGYMLHKLFKAIKLITIKE